jgi:hypothetical protein
LKGKADYVEQLVKEAPDLRFERVEGAELTTLRCTMSKKKEVCRKSHVYTQQRQEEMGL